MLGTLVGFDAVAVATCGIFFTCFAAASTVCGVCENADTLVSTALLLVAAALAIATDSPSRALLATGTTVPWIDVGGDAATVTTGFS